MWMENLDDAAGNFIIGVFASWKFKLDHVTIIKNTSTHKYNQQKFKSLKKISSHKNRSQ